MINAGINENDMALIIVLNNLMNQHIKLFKFSY